MNRRIRTYTGILFDPFHPKIEDINIYDIAHALSNECRYAGHCSKFYSVAEHSVIISKLCSEENALTGLLHDGSEAYVKDLPRPIKHHPKFKFYRDFSNKIQKLIY